MKRWQIVACAALLASGPAGCMSYIASQLNPQGEFSDAAGNLSYWLLFTNVFVLYFLPGFLLLLALCSPALVRRRARRTDLAQVRGGRHDESDG